MRDGASPLGYDPAAVAEMAQMGWTGVIIPEEYGGSDFGCLGLGLILEETGRTLTASPILASTSSAPEPPKQPSAARRSIATGMRGCRGSEQAGVARDGATPAHGTMDFPPDSGLGRLK